MEGTKRQRHKYNKAKRAVKYHPTIGEELEIVVGDKIALTDPEENKRRRTLILSRKNGSWGFTLQSYGIHHRKQNELELFTYIDYVEFGGAAHLAGMRPGDVILSINGKNMEDTEHSDLVSYVKNCGETMRMVVLFEDCCRKVELHLKFLKLKRVLAEKLFELRSLELQETRLMSGLPVFGSRRSSYASNSSLDSSYLDRMSLLPELDVFPLSPHNSSAPVTTDSPQNGTVPEDDNVSLQGAVGGTLQFRSRFEFDRCSLPIGFSGSTSSLASTGTPTFTREKRPMSMRLQYTHRPTSSLVDLQLPIPHKLKPQLIQSASMSSFGSMASIDRRSLAASERSLSKEDVDKSAFRQALAVPANIVHYTASAPPTPMYEMRSLPRDSSRFTRHSSSPSRSEGSSDTSSDSSLCNTLPKMSKKSRISSGNSSPTQMVQLSPISYLIEDADIYEYNTPIECDTTILEAGEDSLAEGNEISIYLSTPKESSTDDISDAEIHDTSLDSADIYGFESESDQEAVDIHEIKVECYTPEVKSVQPGREIVKLETVVPKIQENGNFHMDSMVVNKTVDIDIPKHKEMSNSLKILHDFDSVKVEVTDSIEWSEDSDSHIQDTYATPIKRVIKNVVKEQIGNSEVSISYEEDPNVTPSVETSSDFDNVLPEICPNCAKLEENANNPPGFYAMGEVLSFKDDNVYSPLILLTCTKCEEVYSWSGVTKVESNNMSEQEMFGATDIEELIVTDKQNGLNSDQVLELSDVEPSSCDNTDDMETNDDFIPHGIVQQLIQSIEMEKFNPVDSEIEEKSNDMVLETVNNNNKISDNSKGDNMTMTPMNKAASPSPEEMARAAILDGLSSRGREIWEQKLRAGLPSDADHKAQTLISDKDELTKL